MPKSYVTDQALAARLERAEARANVAFVEARAIVSPSVGAGWRDVDGTFAMFDGPDSPITQTFGLGMFSAPTEGALDEIEAFFAERGADTMHETCPLSDPLLLSILPDRGYRPIEQSSVMYQPLDVYVAPSTPDEIRVVVIEPGDELRWAETASRGWGDTPELAAFMLDFGMLTARAQGMRCYIAEWNGAPAGAAAMFVHEGVSLLAGASTAAEFRRRGVQAALLAARLSDAARGGGDLAMMAAAPGSSSQRNAERRGFRIGYTRTKWCRRREAVAR
jgi:hypothetical protein